MHYHVEAEMSKVLFETVYADDRHVFLDSHVIVFGGPAPLSRQQETYAELEAPDSGYIPTSYDLWLQVYGEVK
jgi:hypothetical protein